MKYGYFRSLDYTILSFLCRNEYFEKRKSKARNVKEKDYPEIFTYKRSLF